MPFGYTALIWDLSLDAMLRENLLFKNWKLTNIETVRN